MRARVSVPYGHNWAYSTLARAVSMALRYNLGMRLESHYEIIACADMLRVRQTCVQG